MKQVSWILTVVIAFVLGWVANGATSSRPVPVRPAPSAAAPSQAQRPARPTEDPKAVYRVPLEDSPVSVKVEVAFVNAT